MSNVPKLRFPGFEGEWERGFVSEVSDINPGNDALPEQFQYIDLESVISGNLTKTNIIKRQNAPSRAQRLLEPDDILFQAVRPYQQNNYLFKGNTKPVVASTGYIQMRVSETPLFMYQLIHTNRFLQQVLVRCTGTSYPAINSNDFATIRINCPGKNEQTKIADFFTLIDKKITKQDKKVAALEQYKKGLMQKIFSRKIRFKNDDGNDYPEWERKKAKEIFYNISDKNHNGDLVVLSVTQDRGTVPREDMAIVIKYDKVNLKNYKRVKENDFIISLRSFQGGIDRSNHNGLVSPAYTVFDVSEPEKHDPRYYGYLLKSNRVINKLNTLIYGIRDGKAIGFNDFSELPIQYPSKSEQTKIANFLGLYDRKIEKEKAKLDALREQKKGLLQQMFV